MYYVFHYTFVLENFDKNLGLGQIPFVFYLVIFSCHLTAL